MFTQAGFREDYIVLGSGTVSLPPSAITVTGYLVEWPCGDRAWASRSRICWPEQVQVHGEPRMRSNPPTHKGEPT